MARRVEKWQGGHQVIRWPGKQPARVTHRQESGVAGSTAVKVRAVHGNTGDLT